MRKDHTCRGEAKPGHWDLTPEGIQLMQQSRLQGKAASIVLPIATAAIAIAVFIADTVTDLEVPFAVMYVVVILLAARFCRARALMLVATGCVALTVRSDTLKPGISVAEGFANTLVSLATILLTTLLALQAQKAAAALQEQ